MVRLKKGMRLKSNSSNSVIVLTGKKNGMGHWNTKKIGSKNNHSIHEETIKKYYSILEESDAQLYSKADL